MSSLSTFDPTNVKTLKASVAELIFDAILSGEFQPGERLNESDLARRLRISRTAMREVLHQLEGEGLLINRPRRGMFVEALTRRDVEDICAIRLMLEAEALRLCKRNLDSHAEEELSQRLEELKKYTPEQVGYFSRVDLGFHRAIWRIAGNKHLEKTLVRLTAPLFIFGASHARIRKLNPSHSPILEFLQGKSNQSAQQVVLQHLKAGLLSEEDQEDKKVVGF